MIISGDELYDFYAHLGQAVHAVQIVEGTLHSILAIRVHFEQQRPTQEEADAILEKYRAKTLGGLIGDAKKAEALPNEIIRHLEDLNAERREVIHRLREQTDANLRANSAFRDHIVGYLQNVADLAFDLNSQLVAELIRGRPDILASAQYGAEFNRQLRKQGFI